MRDLLFYIRTPLTRRDHKRYGVDVLKSRGWRAVFLDMTAVLHPGFTDSHAPADLSDYPEVLAAGDRETALSLLKENRSALGVDMVGCQESSWFFHRALRRWDVPYVQFRVNAVPSPGLSSHARSWEAFRGRLGPGRLARRLRKMIFESLAGRAGVFQPPRYVLRGGRRGGAGFPRQDGRTETVWAHALDYDLYLERSTPVETPGGHAVFLDEYFPFHPDFDLLAGADPRISADLYYAGLNRLFDAVEETFKVPVIIAAHPKSRYGEGPDFFKGRKVALGETLPLVAGARLVLAHASTSINFAVMCGKPIVFVTSNAIERGWHGALVATFAAELGGTLVNVDRLGAGGLPARPQVDAGRYRSYRESYIKVPGTPEKPFWEIAADAFSSEEVQ